MSDMALPRGLARLPQPGAVLTLLKPITWFAPMWAFGCGVVSSGAPASGRWPLIIAGVALAGPLVCATSQAANDWFDRHVDAVNEPDRPIPSGRIPGQWGLIIALCWTGFSAAIALLLGPWASAAALFGLALAWAYSAPPIRLKRNGWWGNAACAACYEGLPWLTGAAIMTGTAPGAHILIAAGLYSLGAHGIMTLNDFKSTEGDRLMGIDSLPVLLGETRAAQVACLTMAAPQLVMIAALVAWHAPIQAACIAVSLGIQLVLMRKFLGDPRKLAPWYNGTGTTLYVLGMLITAFAIQ